MSYLEGPNSTGAVIRETQQLSDLRRHSAEVIARAEQAGVATGEIKVWVNALVDALEASNKSRAISADNMSELVDLREQWAALAEPGALAGLPRVAVEASVRDLAEELLRFTEQPLPCPHGRRSWTHCPHCLGLNQRFPQS